MQHPLSVQERIRITLFSAHMKEGNDPVSKVLYFQKSSSPSHTNDMLGKLKKEREYTARFCDNAGEHTHLALCLETLKTGDTLYVASETDLARDVGSAVDILGDLARRGVNVWIDRTEHTIFARRSPYRHLGRALAETLASFHARYCTYRMTQGRKNTTKKIGRPSIVLPEGFEEARDAWLSGRLRGTEAAARCGMALSTFRKWAKRSV